MLDQSATLAINERLREREAAGRRVLHLGFGEAGLPVLPEVREVLAGAGEHNAYEPVAGTAGAREAAAGYLARRGLPTTPEQVVLAPGSKALLFGLLAALDGDLILPKPCWVSYPAQAAVLGKRVLRVDTPEHAGGFPHPDALERLLDSARRDGATPGILVLTTPDNPTGTIAPAELVRDVCRVADRHGLVVISDEIYRDLAHDGYTVHSPAGELPERTVVTTGLSKSMALGGYRVGFARIPDSPSGRALHGRLIGVASEVWSCLSGPMQAVAEYVLGEPEPVCEHILASARLHQRVARAFHQEFVAAGADCRPPAGGFYLYPDLAPMLPAHVPAGAEITTYLLERHDIGVLAGSEFGDDSSATRFRVATSLCYGRTAEQRWTALHSTDPLSCPWIAESVEHLRRSLATL